MLSLWRNRLARSAVNRKVGGSSPPRDECFFYFIFIFFIDLVFSSFLVSASYNIWGGSFAFYFVLNQEQCEGAQSYEAGVMLTSGSFAKRGLLVLVVCLQLCVSQELEILYEQSVALRNELG